MKKVSLGPLHKYLGHFQQRKHLDRGHNTSSEPYIQSLLSSQLNAKKSKDKAGEKAAQGLETGLKIAKALQKSQVDPKTGKPLVSSSSDLQDIQDNVKKINRKIDSLPSVDEE